MNLLICYLQERPGHGFIASILSFAIGYIQVEQATMNFVTWVFQLGAFTLSMLAAIITIYAQLRKIKGKKCTEKREK
jgi:hypothetical protein